MRIPRGVRAAVLILGAVVVWPATMAVAADPDAADSEVAPAGGGDRLPDLVMARPYGEPYPKGPLYLETRPNGQVWLRFGTIGWNVGAGPLEARGTKPNPDDDYMVVRQRIYQTGGGFRTRRTSAVMYHDGADGHDHWHLRQFISATLYKVGGPDDVWGLRKIGFCLLDARRRTSPPRGPSSPRYPFDACGDGDSTSLRMGISRGWGDDYPPDFAHQFINVTDIPTGRYRLCLTVDPLNEFREEREDNNQRWTDIRINLLNDTVTFKAFGGVRQACGPSLP